MSKTSYKNNINAKRLQLSVVAKNGKGEVITYNVKSKDGKFSRNIPNGIGGVVATDEPKDKKSKGKATAKKSKSTKE